MNGPAERSSMDASLELRFALAEGDAVDADAGLRTRVLSAAAASRAPGPAIDRPERISGREALDRIMARLDRLLAELAPSDWSAVVVRYPSVQELVGHLIGVEEAFLTVLAGGTDPALDSDHRAMTELAVLRQRGRSAVAVAGEWRDRMLATRDALSDRDLSAATTFYGTTFDLDELLVVRAFEMWIHDEDIRRAVGRPIEAPDPSTLARMVELAVSLVPTGVALAGRTQPERTVRVVLTGPGGGTWDINLDGSPEPRPADARVVVDAAWFCRVVGDREDGPGAGAVVDGEAEVAADLLVGAAALAFD